MTARRPDILDMIHELTQPTHHREPYLKKRKPRYHTTHNPPLLAQLAAAAFPGTIRIEGPGGSVTGGIAGSRPTASIEAIDTHNRIHFQASTRLTDLGRDTTGTTIDLVRRLGAIAAGLDTPTQRAIERDVRNWRSRIRIITGWDTPPWTPANTCPICESRGTLRVRLADKLAMCIGETCNATWDEATIGLLAEHIRHQNGDRVA